MATGTKTSTVADSGARVSEKTGGAYANMAAVIQSELNRIVGNAGPNAGLVIQQDASNQEHCRPNSNGSPSNTKQK